jgi:2-polyprenyl-3-methyl-5-hydroxy-6-metoxy-1,4-benzoquinol methylase
MNSIETKHLKTRWIYLFNNDIHKFFINKNVLDIGCLDGYSTNQFIKNGAKNATGIDIENKYIKKAKLEYPNITFKIKDAEQLNNFKNIDVISCLGLIYLLTDPVKFLTTISIQKNSNTIIIETVLNNNKICIENGFYFLNTGLIKKIFQDNGWTLSYEKIFIVKDIANKINNDIDFGNRIMLVFERKV